MSVLNRSSTRYQGEKLPPHMMLQPHHRTAGRFRESPQAFPGASIKMTPVQRPKQGGLPNSGVRTSSAPVPRPHIRSSYKVSMKRK